MNYNNIINHLKLWCRDKAAAYHIEYANYGGISYVGYQNAYELDFKLSSIIDKSFESIEAFLTDIYGFTDTHYNPSLLKPLNKVAQHIIEKINQEFIDYFMISFPSKMSSSWRLFHIIASFLVRKRKNCAKGFIPYGNMSIHHVGIRSWVMRPETYRTNSLLCSIILNRIWSSFNN